MDKLRGNKDWQAYSTSFIDVLFSCPWIEERGNQYQIVIYNIDIIANNVYIIE
mgnify:CR=1 FL=1